MRVVLPAVIFIGAAIYLYAAQQIPVPAFGGPVNATVFPTLLGIALAAASVMLFFETRALPAKPTAEQGGSPLTHMPVVVGVILWTALYSFAFEPLGYVLSTSVYLIGLTLYFYRKNRVVAVLSSIGFAVCAYLVISKLLMVKLPVGLFS